MKVELLCSCEKEELEKRIQKVAAAGKLSRFKGNVFEVLENCNDYEKNLKLIKTDKIRQKASYLLRCLFLFIN